MSKLDGNERWKSKMLLPEHHEQYQERGRRPASGVPSEEELRMIRDSVLLPHLLTMVQRGLQEVQYSTSILKRLFAAAGQLLQNRIQRDLYTLRRELDRRNIRVVSDEHADTVLYYRYTCRGYEDRFGIVREMLRAEIGIRLARYIHDTINLAEQK
jgi:hypothetical protein